MKEVKAILSGLGVFIILIGIFYLLGSLSQATFNLTNWSQEARVSVSLLGGMIATIAGFILTMTIIGE